VDTKRGLLYIGTGENYSNPSTIQATAIQALDKNRKTCLERCRLRGMICITLPVLSFINCPQPGGLILILGWRPILVKRKDGKENFGSRAKIGRSTCVVARDGKLICNTICKVWLWVEYTGNGY